MSKAVFGRPQPHEYAESHALYFSKVPGDDVLSFLQQQLDSTLVLFRPLDEATGNRRYEPSKWSVKEVLGHIVDSERVFAYRAVTFARGDRSPLPGFDQDVWAQNTNYAQLLVADIAAEFESVRRSTILLFKHLAPEAWDRRGTANNKEITTRAVAYSIAGHAQHHLEILKERYQV